MRRNYGIMQVKKWLGTERTEEGRGGKPASTQQKRERTKHTETPPHRRVDLRHDRCRHQQDIKMVDILAQRDDDLLLGRRAGRVPGLEPLRPPRLARLVPEMARRQMRSQGRAPGRVQQVLAKQKQVPKLLPLDDGGA